MAMLLGSSIILWNGLAALLIMVALVGLAASVGAANKLAPARFSPFALKGNAAPTAITLTTLKAVSQKTVTPVLLTFAVTGLAVAGIAWKRRGR